MSMIADVFVVSDDPDLLPFFRAILTADGQHVTVFVAQQDYLTPIWEQHPAVVILSFWDGTLACRQIRQRSQVPIIIISPQDEESARVSGLDAGADDYIVVPFSAWELQARVRAVLRRARLGENPPETHLIRHDNLTIDPHRYSVLLDGQSVFLSASEFRLLIELAQNMGKTLTAEHLLAKVWGEEYLEDKEILWVCVARLRQKLEADPHNPQHILTRPGLGYEMPLAGTTA